MLTLDDLQAKAWRLMSATTPKLVQPNPDAALFKYWKAHKEVGTPMCDEVAVIEGGTALYTSTGRILHWLGGEEVEVLQRVDRNVDFRYSEGHPGVWKARADGTRMVRCISLPANDTWAGLYLEAGIRVIGVYTGESDAADRYIMRNVSAIQIGNEPQFAMAGAASWPTGTAEDMANVWAHVARVLVPSVHPGGIPLIGPGIWAQDWRKWAMIADRLDGLSAAAVHCYPEPSLQTIEELRYALGKYRAVRSDLPLICTEYTVRGKLTLGFARAIDAYCDSRLWFGPAGVPGHQLEGTPEYGILALTK